MTAFVVMNKSASEPGGATEFVRDRFAVIAFVAPVIWLAWHRLWIEALVALAAAAGLAALGTLSGFENSAPLLSMLVSVFVAIEGPQLRVSALERRGYREMTVVEADSAADAELQYFSRFASRSGKQTAPPVKAPVRGSNMAQPAAVGPALGLLDYPGGR